MSLKYTKKSIDKLAVEGLFIPAPIFRLEEEQVKGSCVFFLSKNEQFKEKSVVYFFSNETNIHENLIDYQTLFKDLITYALLNKMASIAIPLLIIEETFSLTTDVDHISNIILNLIENEKINVTLMIEKRESFLVVHKSNTI